MFNWCAISNEQPSYNAQGEENNVKKCIKSDTLEEFCNKMQGNQHKPNENCSIFSSWKKQPRHNELNKHLEFRPDDLRKEM